MISNIQDAKLEVLIAERDLLNSAYNAKYSQIICELEAIINKWFVSPFNAKCLRRWVATDYSDTRGIFINFEIGFHNLEEDKTDFGSDIYFSYSSVSNCLNVNYGTCGLYNRNDVYQVRRVQMLAHVWNNITDIEAELKAYAEKIAPVIIQCEESINAVEKEIREIQYQMKKEQLENIESMLNVGLRMTYGELHLKKSLMLFFDTATITKITPKFVTLVSNSKEYKVKKEELVLHIFKNYIEIEENE